MSEPSPDGRPKVGNFFVRRLLASSVLLGLVVALLPAAATAATYNSAAVPTWVPNGQVWAMAVTPSRIYLGGDFTSLQNPVTGATFAANNLVAIEKSTGNPSTTWRPSVVGNPAEFDVNGFRTNPPVAALNWNTDGTLYVGGDFNSVSGKTRNFAAAIDKDGQVLDSWAPVVTGGRVWDFARAGSQLYMVGQFGKVNDVNRSGAALVSATTGATDITWDAGLTGRAQAIALSGGKVFLGGTFTKIHGRDQSFLGSVDATTGADTTWNPASQCTEAAAGADCRIRDLAVDSTRLYAAIGGEPGGRAAAWALASMPAIATPIWKQNADGEVQAVTVYDGVVYFGGHFSTHVTEMDLTQDPPAAGENHVRNQFYAVNPATGDVLPYTLPFINPATPGLRVLAADAQGLRIGGQTQIAGKPYKNFLTFAAPGVVIAGPTVPPPPVTTVTVKTKGCKTCKVRLTQKQGGGALWNSGWKKASKGTTVFSVPTAKTVGLTVSVDAPWEKKFSKTAEVAMRYQGKSVGSKVSAKAAAKAKKASSCYGGTSATALTFNVTVNKAKSGKKVGTRAWASTTQKYRNPTRKAPKGVLSTKTPTTCS